MTADASSDVLFVQDSLQNIHARLAGNNTNIYAAGVHLAPAVFSEWTADVLQTPGSKRFIYGCSEVSFADERPVRARQRRREQLGAVKAYRALANHRTNVVNVHEDLLQRCGLNLCGISNRSRFKTKAAVHAFTSSSMRSHIFVEQTDLQDAVIRGSQENDGKLAAVRSLLHRLLV
jgi:hypothetical protein